MMFGGSPIRVAVPPRLETIAWVMTYIRGFSPIPRVSSITMGTMMSTVVTLSKKADMVAVTMENSVNILRGLPPVNLAMRTLRIMKNPDLRNTATITIIPSSSMIVSISM